MLYIVHVICNFNLGQGEYITFISLEAFRPSPCWPKSSISTCSALPPFSLNHWVKLAMWFFLEWTGFSNNVWSAKHKSNVFLYILLTWFRKLVTISSTFQHLIHQWWGVYAIPLLQHQLKKVPGSSDLPKNNCWKVLDKVNKNIQNQWDQMIQHNS